MQITSPTILSTPLEICQVVWQHFPTAQAKVQQDVDNAAMLNIKIAEQIPSIYVGNILDAAIFSKAVEDLKRECEINQILGNHEAIDYAFNRRVFSLETPLSADWQSFRRVLHEKDHGKNYADLIIAYLQNPHLEKQLEELGFASHQVEEAIKDEDFVFFQQFLLKLNIFSQEERRSLFHLFKSRYPKMCYRILQERHQKEKNRHAGNDVYQQILTILGNRVIGQDQAAEKMACALASHKNQAENNVFLFVGPSGVGKTELAKAASTWKENRFVMFAMNQFQSETDVSRLFGSSSGYVGSTDKPHLAQALDKYEPLITRIDGSKTFLTISNVVILFDEFEKAHSKVKQSLLTLFDESLCIVNYTNGRKNVTFQYKLEKCSIITTSNLFQKEILSAFQAQMSIEQICACFEKLNANALSLQCFSPELLGRVSIIPFGPISKGKCYQTIIKLKLTEFISKLQTEFSCRAIDIEHENLILLALENKLYGDGVNIRKLSRYFNTIKSLIYKKQWNAVESKKMVFSYNGKEPCVKLMKYFEDWETDHLIDEIVFL